MLKKQGANWEKIGRKYKVGFFSSWEKIFLQLGKKPDVGTKKIDCLTTTNLY